MIVLATLNHEREHRGGCQTLDDDYVTLFEACGAHLLALPSSQQLPSDVQLDGFGARGLLLTGGNDVDPALYGQANTHSRGLSAQRDAFESRLLEWAMCRHLPVLGICRGFQFLNARLGGSLHQDLSLIKEKHEGRGIHTVDLEPEAQKLLGVGASHEVDSRHHQCVTNSTLSPLAKAWAHCGAVVEAYNIPGKPVAAVQWHPESPKSARNLSQALATAFLQRRAYWSVS
ncbi:MAG: gamma-glutamyl-gamma-aminobutyrate hydrolase family protein [Planctomycetota bacterium]